jgi:hypothetical protein
LQKRKTPDYIVVIIRENLSLFNISGIIRLYHPSGGTDNLTSYLKKDGYGRSRYCGHADVFKQVFYKKM